MDVTLPEALADAFDELLGEIHTAFPGRVTKYDVATQTADVKPLLRHEGASLPVLANVPVAFPRGGGAYLTFPIAAGDFVFVLCAESSLDQWRAKSGAETEPGDPRRFSLTGAVALPCLYPSSRALADAHADRVRLGVDGGKSVSVSETQVALGAPGATDAVALASLVLARLSAIVTGFNLHVHSGVTTGAGSSGPPGSPLSAPASVASTVVRSE